MHKLTLFLFILLSFGKIWAQERSTGSSIFLKDSSLSFELAPLPLLCIDSVNSELYHYSQKGVDIGCHQVNYLAGNAYEYEIWSELRRWPATNIQAQLTAEQDGFLNARSIKQGNLFYLLRNSPSPESNRFPALFLKNGVLYYYSKLGDSFSYQKVDIEDMETQDKDYLLGLSYEDKLTLIDDRMNWVIKSNSSDEGCYYHLLDHPPLTIESEQFPALFIRDNKIFHYSVVDGQVVEQKLDMTLGSQNEVLEFSDLPILNFSNIRHHFDDEQVDFIQSHLCMNYFLTNHIPTQESGMFPALFLKGDGRIYHYSIENGQIEEQVLFFDEKSEKDCEDKAFVMSLMTPPSHMNQKFEFNHILHNLVKSHVGQNHLTETILLFLQEVMQFPIALRLPDMFYLQNCDYKSEGVITIGDYIDRILFKIKTPKGFIYKTLFYLFMLREEMGYIVDMNNIHKLFMIAFGLVYKTYEDIPRSGAYLNEVAGFKETVSMELNFLKIFAFNLFMELDGKYKRVFENDFIPYIKELSPAMALADRSMGYKTMVRRLRDRGKKNGCSFCPI